MVGERNRILKLTEYLTALGIDVNIGKTKARGHKGIFMQTLGNYRIDVSKGVDDANVLSTLLHEFAHYIHYSYDKTLKSLDFVFNDFSEDIREELIKITVQDVPKDFALELYKAKDSLSEEIRMLTEKIKLNYPAFKISEINKDIEKFISHPFNYLLRYDNVKYFNKLFSVNRLEEYADLSNIQKDYIRLKSKQRALKRINSKINRLNKYYNNSSELFARFIDAYYTKPDLTYKLAPTACSKLKKSNIKLLEELNNIFS